MGGAPGSASGRANDPYLRAIAEKLPVETGILLDSEELRVGNNKSVDNCPLHFETQHSFFTMLAPQLTPSLLAGSAPSILQFPTEAFRPVRSLHHMTTQLLQEAAQVIPNQQLLINVVSKRVRQLGLGHRPMVEVGPRASLTDIALKEIIAGKLTYESVEGSSDGA